MAGDHTHVRALVCAGLTTAWATLAAMMPVATGYAGDPHLDPAALPRGAAPAVAHMVRDVIRDGDRRIPATTRGRHEALWTVDGGYVLRDYNVGRPRTVRVVFIDGRGETRLIARSREWVDVVVSDNGRRVAYQRSSVGTGTGVVVGVEKPRSGRLLARREFRLANLVAVTGTRVLLGRRLRWHDPATTWWHYGRDRMTRVAGQAAVGADVGHDRVVFNTSSVGEFCNRVAVLSRPARTLWRSCGIHPHQWSPNGRRAIATRTYFDAAGTDVWRVVHGRTGVRESRITGRLDWDAVWEGDSHFLTMAQSDAGRVAVVRCDVDGACERASRLWEVPVPPDLYYASPPVVLAHG
jgi:hypothetical protein